MNTFLYHSIRWIFLSMGALPASTARAVSRWMGGLWFRLDPKRRRICLDNLERAFGTELSPARRRNLARQVYGNIPLIFFEVGRALKHPPDHIQRLIRITGQQHLEDAHARGRGVLLLTAHIGNWELLTYVARATGLPMAVVYRPLDFKPLNRLVEEFRSRFGIRLIIRRFAMRRILRSLCNGECVAILLDQSIGRKKAVFVNFFGHPTCTNKGMALLAMKTEAPVVPVFLVRDGDGFIAEFGPALPLIKTGGREQDAETNTALYNQAIESMVRRYPEQWFWVHNRWKRKPDQLEPDEIV